MVVWGLESLEVLNKALIGKCLWRYALERDSPWRIIQCKYGEVEKGWCTLDLREALDMGLWKAMRRG